DFHVTGVQTCALPIYAWSGCVRDVAALAEVLFDDVASRAETRRRHLPRDRDGELEAPVVPRREVLHAQLAHHDVRDDDERLSPCPERRAREADAHHFSNRLLTATKVDEAHLIAQVE